MKFTHLTPELVEPFRAFCRKHRAMLDESFLSEEDLAQLSPGPECPTVLGIGPDGVAAAASLVLDDYHLRGRRSRFRILYSETEAVADYRRLLDAVHPEPGLVDSWFVFVKDGSGSHRALLEAAGFHLERTSHVLVREALPVAPSEMPEDVRIRPFRFGQDEAAYVRIRNAAFAGLLGSQTPLTVADIARYEQDGETIPGGIFLLEASGCPVGVVRTVRDPGEDVNRPMLEIGPLAIEPGHQGKGYGTLLLRHALRFGAETAGLPRAVLSVNAENTPALGLYLREGFSVAEGYACMRQELKGVHGERLP